MECSGCHDAGTFDSSGSPFGDIAGTGNKLEMDLGNVSNNMNGITLTNQEILDLKAFLDSPLI